MIDWALRAARLLQYASVLSLAGAALLSSDAEARRSVLQGICTASRARRLLPAAAAVGFAAMAAWLPLESISLTGNWTSWSVLLVHTRFGRIDAARAALLAWSALACLWFREPRAVRAAIGLPALVALASFAWTGHGTMGAGAGRWVHLGCDVLHLLCAGLWVGALGSLTVQAFRNQPEDPDGMRLFGGRLARFSRIGPAIVGVLAVTGVANGAFVLGSHPWNALLDSPYGSVLLAKLGLFALMLPLAALNRLRLTPALQIAAGTSPAVPACEATLRLLRRSLAAESLLALLVLAAVAILGTLAPPASS